MLSACNCLTSAISCWTFTYCLLPCIDFQVSYLRMPPKLAVLTTGLVGVAALMLVGFVVAGALSRMV